ncbi:MAG: histone deacetylase family protein [Pseudomonadales bacterium]|nr:histone deacetylase family protein [Pseudomonadales bacterium]NRA15093.1 histone deacetylase family protein [Oceanospirillaceae bacterium]
MSVAIISHPQCSLHYMGVGHPEQPGRVQVIDQQINSSELSTRTHHYQSAKVTSAQLHAAHSAQYIEQIYASAPDSGIFQLDADTQMMPETLAAAEYAAGSGVMGVDLLMQGKHRAAFCPVRPPGHHAERAAAMGFCFFSNVAIAALHAIAEYSLERVAIVDFDVHHGNGTQEILQNNPNILFCSSFQHPFYPFSGAGITPGNVHNLPLAANISSAEYRSQVSQWLTAVDDYAPQLLIISAGFDGHIEDQMSSHRLSDADYYWITQKIVALADQHAQGRVLSMLEGGYAINALGDTVVAHLKALLHS